MLLKKITYFIVILNIILTLFVSLPVGAQSKDTSDITVFPALFEISAEPGSRKKTTLLIVNNSEEPLPVQLEIKSLIPTDEIIDLSKRSEFDASRWVDITTKSLALEPNQTVKVPIEIDIPKEASPGGHYAEIIVKKLVLQGQNSGEANTVLIPQVKTPILITVAGDANEEIILESGDHFPGFIQKMGSVNTELTIANTGTTHLLPTARVQVLKNGEVKQEISYTPGVILPNTKKNFVINWKPDIPIGLFDFRVNVTYGDEQINLITQPEKAVVFFPVWLIFLLFSLSIIIGFLAAKRQNISKAIKVLKGSKGQA